MYPLPSARRTAGTRDNGDDCLFPGSALGGTWAGATRSRALSPSHFFPPFLCWELGFEEVGCFKDNGEIWCYCCILKTTKPERQSWEKEEQRCSERGRAAPATGQGTRLEKRASDLREKRDLEEGRPGSPQKLPSMVRKGRCCIDVSVLVLVFPGDRSCNEQRVNLACPRVLALGGPVQRSCGVQGSWRLSLWPRGWGSGTSRCSIPLGAEPGSATRPLQSSYRHTPAREGVCLTNQACLR